VRSGWRRARRLSCPAERVRRRGRERSPALSDAVMRKPLLTHVVVPASPDGETRTRTVDTTISRVLSRMSLGIMARRELRFARATQTPPRGDNQHCHRHQEALVAPEDGRPPPRERYRLRSRGAIPSTPRLLLRATASGHREPLDRRQRQVPAPTRRQGSPRAIQQTSYSPISRLAAPIRNRRRARPIRPSDRRRNTSAFIGLAATKGGVSARVRRTIACSPKGHSRARPVGLVRWSTDAWQPGFWQRVGSQVIPVRTGELSLSRWSAIWVRPRS
jgi:hypothetical protein